MPANIVIYFAASALLTFLSYVVAGLISTRLVGLWLLIGPVYGLGLWTGSRCFGMAIAAAFRGICYALIAAAGIFSLAFRDPWHGVAVGGDFTPDTSAPDGSATTRDGGRTWTVSKTVPGEYRSGAFYNYRQALAVGPTGSDISTDGGRTWKRFDTGSFDAVLCARDGACWASGENGRVAKLSRR